jgi:hypothetical protein
VLGTKPILLSPFRSGGQRHVFAASDRPTIIYSNNRKLLYRYVGGWVLCSVLGCAGAVVVVVLVVLGLLVG